MSARDSGAERERKVIKGIILAAIERWSHLTPYRTQKWNADAPMVVWGFPM